MTLPDGEPYETEDSILSLDGDDIHVCQDGPRDAPALLLIHGSASSTLTWDPMVPLLTKAHHVIRIDLLGHGRSAKPDGGYEFPAQERRAGMALDRLGVERAIVAGHSSGGMVATALAEQRPDLVTALVLINTGPGMDAFTAPESDSIGPSQWQHLRTDPAVVDAWRLAGDCDYEARLTCRTLADLDGAVNELRAAGGHTSTTLVLHRVNLDER